MSLNKSNRLKTLVTPITMLLPCLSSALETLKHSGENDDPDGDMGWEIEILNNIPQ